MKYVIFVFIVGVLRGLGLNYFQENLITLNLKYDADTCNYILNTTRIYLNDSVFIEKQSNLIDTLMVKEGKLFRLNYGKFYKLIDVDEDFNPSNTHYKYYYDELSPHDTLQKEGETKADFQWRLKESTIVFIPVSMVKLNGREMFKYYILNSCKPYFGESCIKARIANGQYGVRYFEKGIGYAGFSGAQSKCVFTLTEASLQMILKLPRCR